MSNIKEIISVNHSMKPAPELGLVTTDPLYLSTSESAAHYRPCPVRFQFGDKQDHVRIHDVTTWLKNEGLCKASTKILVGGLNEGQFATTLLDICPSATLHGVEVQPDVFEKVKSTLARYPNAAAHNQGWSDSSGELFIAGKGQTAQLVDAEKARKSGTTQMVKVGTILNLPGTLALTNQFTPSLTLKATSLLLSRVWRWRTKLIDSSFRCFNLKLEVDGTNFPNYTGTNIRLQSI